MDVNGVVAGLWYVLLRSCALVGSRGQIYVIGTEDAMNSCCLGFHESS